MAGSLSRKVVAALMALLSSMFVLASVAQADLPAPGTRLWAATADSGARKAIAVSPDGSTVFVSGEGRTPDHGSDYVTIAYHTSDGSVLWRARYNGPANGDDFVADGQQALAVSPDGTTVFVTGSTDHPTNLDYATVAYDAQTGTQLWVSRFGSVGWADYGGSLVVSPLGDRLFVTGESYSPTYRSYGYVTVAYDASTGGQLWMQRYSPSGPYATSFPRAIAVSPDGGRVFVTGLSNVSSVPNVYDYATVAYQATTGSQLWVRRYDGRAHGDDMPSDMAVSLDGLSVFVTGSSQGWSSGRDFATIAYAAATGTRLWVRRYDGPGHGADVPTSITVGPLGGQIFVTGDSLGTTTASDWVTIAYQGSTGSDLWRRRYSGPGHERPHAVAAYPDGSAIVVAGYTRRSSNGSPVAFTVSYGAAAGTFRWARQYGDPSRGEVGATDVAVSGDCTRLFVSGGGNYPLTLGRFRVTIAYAA